MKKLWVSLVLGMALFCTPALAVEFDLAQAIFPVSTSDKVATVEKDGLTATFSTITSNTYMTLPSAPGDGIKITRLSGSGLLGSISLSSPQENLQIKYATAIPEVGLSASVFFAGGGHADIDVPSAAAGVLDILAALNLPLAQGGYAGAFAGKLISSVQLLLTRETSTGLFCMSVTALTATPPTPIPGAALLLGTGIVGLFGLRRRASKA